MGLANFYDLKAQSSNSRGKEFIVDELNNHQYPLKKYNDETKEGEVKSYYHIEDMYCPACVWLVEQLPKINTDIHYAWWNGSREILTIKSANPLVPQKIIGQLQEIGFKSHPISIQDYKEFYSPKSSRSQIIKMGVTFALAANIMLLSLGIYTGLSGLLGNFVHIIIGMLAFPILTIGAWDIYKSAWRSLKIKTFNIDITLALAIIFGAGFSYISLIKGNTQHNYLDSLALFVVLLNIARTLKNLGLKLPFTNKFAHNFFQSEFYSVFNKEKGKYVKVARDDLKIGDLLKIHVKEMVPGNIKIKSGKSFFDFRHLTGEPLPKTCDVNQEVQAGAINLHSTITGRLTQDLMSSEMGKILSEIKNHWGKITLFQIKVHLLSKYFFITLYLIVTGTILTFGLYYNDWYQGIIRSITLLILACPCAFSVSAPLTYGLALKKLAELGIYIKGEDKLEKIPTIKNVFFDKTGTLTESTYIPIIENLDFPLEKIHNYIYFLEEKSRHPLGLALFAASRTFFAGIEPNPNNFTIRDWREIPGQGVEARINNQFVSIVKDNDSTALIVDKVKVAKIHFKKRWKPHLESIFSDLQKRGLNLQVLSGDGKMNEESLANFGVTYLGNLSPEQKADIVGDTPNSLFIGDGLNDLLAYKRADLAICVNNSTSINFEHADIIILDNDLSSFDQLFTQANKLNSIIDRNFYLSLVYNTIGGIFCLTGAITPLIAAIVMPLSSFTIIIHTTGSLFRLFKKDHAQ
jgi:P-type E1-E2 ATPase